MSGQPDTVTNKTELPDFVQPYAKDYLASTSQVARQPYQPYGGQRVAGLNDVQYGAMDATMNRAMQGTPEQAAGRANLTGTLSGQYLGAQAPRNAQADVRNEFAGSNPHLQGMIDASAGDIARNYSMTAAPTWRTANNASGSFGNAGLAEMEALDRSNLQRNIGDVSRQMRFADYTQQQGLAENRAQRQFTAGENLAQRQQGLFDAERGRQMQGLAMVPGFASMDYQDIDRMIGVGDALQRQQQAYFDDDYSRFTEARDYPLRQLDILGRGLGMNYGSTQTGQQPGPNKGAGMLGGAMLGAQMGSIIPGLGTGIGAGAGALLGLLGI